MPEQPADDRQTQTETSPKTRVGVSQIVQPDTLEASMPRYEPPGAIEIVTRSFWIVARDDLGTNMR